MCLTDARERWLNSSDPRDAAVAARHINAAIGSYRQPGNIAKECLSRGALFGQGTSPARDRDDRPVWAKSINPGTLSRSVGDDADQQAPVGRQRQRERAQGLGGVVHYRRNDAIKPDPPKTMVANIGNKEPLIRANCQTERTIDPRASGGGPVAHKNLPAPALATRGRCQLGYVAESPGVFLFSF